MSVTAIAAASGVHPATVAPLAWAAHSGARQRVRTSTAAALLTVRRPIDAAPDQAFILAVGTVRRLHALHAIGWPADQIGARIGMSKSHISFLCRRQGQVSAGRARAIRDVYEELQGQPGPSRLSRDRAAAQGWAPPAAWDDIDDPQAVPTGVRTLTAAAPPVDLAEVRHLLDLRESLDWVAVRLGVAPESVVTAARRNDCALYRRLVPDPDGPRPVTGGRRRTSSHVDETETQQ
jgi:hypothetical protein